MKSMTCISRDLWERRGTRLIAIRVLSHYVATKVFNPVDQTPMSSYQQATVAANEASGSAKMVNSEDM
ncbi:hypothetical protein GUITHDRAFT_108223 [Guillardia theta CCMP2712]|uniref:Uncharacterized protein n=1 Tax=Guillardia theta (strain CCMP2712) TaxID=905079 RepID=L1JCH5_GUITC|nr:hypothetical protein GUITHDRAFT_108223 [Guillardia theta CCMP2712]EKX45770.1 hypothetical protein GUITHDRAFT_108223 [Guillardia theta CCMP2712]|eukprot:XP_005832750.1 hypothetical protein GUITHDRAFT_108223 [Guillardia theta CCMP2712]